MALDCSTCKHFQHPEPGNHCYMFKEKPDGDCAKHTNRPRPDHHAIMANLILMGLIDPQVFGSRNDLFCSGAK